MERPIRKRVRLHGYDYSRNGAYFVTICTHNREMLFGNLSKGMMELNQNGLIVKRNINILNALYNGITVDKYVIMPNHVHMIITICRERIVCVPNDNLTKSLISKIIQVFKSSTTKEIRNADGIQNDARNACNAFPTVIWQPHFHDHIIRDKQEYLKIWTYIDTNPAKWEEDCNYNA